MNVNGLNQLGSQSSSLKSMTVNITTDDNATSTPISNDSSSNGDTKDTVSISADALKALSSDNGATMHNNATQAQTKADSSSEDSADPAAKIEKQIKELKQQLKELQQQLQELRGDNSKQADTQRQQLQAQIGMINGQIVMLTNQKANLANQNNAG